MATGPAGEEPGGTARDPLAAYTVNLTERAQYGGAHVGGTATGDTEAGAAFAINCLVEQKVDALMRRTAWRPRWTPTAAAWTRRAGDPLR